MDTTQVSGTDTGGAQINPFAAAEQQGMNVGSTGTGQTQAGASTPTPATNESTTQTSPSPGGDTTQTVQQGVQTPAGAPGTQVQQGATTGAQGGATPTPPGITLTPDQLATLTNSIRAGVTPPAGQPGQGQQGQAQGQGQPNPGEFNPATATQEQFDQYYGVYRPKEEDVAQIFRGGPEGTQKLTEVLHSTAKMGATIAMRQMLGELRKHNEHITQKVQPFVERSEQQQRDEHAKAFFTTYDGFTPEHSPILMAVHDQLTKEGFKGTPEQAYQAVADRAAQWIKTINPAFLPKKSSATATSGQQQSSANGAQATTQPASEMAQLVHTNSGAGAATNNTQQKTESDAKTIFGRLG